MNHYEELGVSETATPDEIKRAYRQKAAQTHPDKGGGDAEFVKVARAYEVLKDPERKLLYDQTGQDNRTPIEIAVQSSLLQAFSQALAGNDDARILETVRSGFKLAQHDIAETEKKVRARRKKLKIRREKVKTTDAVNVVHLLVDKELCAIEGCLNELKYLTELNKACLAALQSYSEEPAPSLVTHISVAYYSYPSHGAT